MTTQIFQKSNSGRGLAFAVGALMVIAIPATSQAQNDPVNGAIGGAATGTYEGKQAGGPIGGLVGGALGAGVGAVTGTLNGVVGTADRVTQPTPLPPPTAGYYDNQGVYHPGR